MFDDSSKAGFLAALRAEVGRVDVGARIPSSRELVRRYRVSPATVSRAVAQLVAEGSLQSRPGAGVFRIARPTDPPRPVDTAWQQLSLPGDNIATAATLFRTLGKLPLDVIDLNSGYLHPSLQPETLLAQSLSRSGRRAGAWARPPIEGLTELRDWFARDIGSAVTAADILIANGGQAALSIALRALTSAGGAVVVENPTYPGMLAILRSHGFTPVAVPTDDHGIRADLLDQALTESAAKVVVVQPFAQNPSGSAMTATRAQEVLAVAASHRAFIVEDDFARYLRHSDNTAQLPPLLQADTTGAVVHIRSLTKASSANLRVAAVAARGYIFERLRAYALIDSLFVAAPMQQLALELTSTPGWRQHLRRLARDLQLRRETLTGAVAHHLPLWQLEGQPRGGYHLWYRLPPGTDGETIATRALSVGVALTPGAQYFVGDAPGQFVRLSFAHAATAEQLITAAERLATVT